MLQLQAIVSLNKSGFESGLTSLTQLASNASQAMMAAFGGVGMEIIAMGKAFGPVGAAVATLKSVTSAGMDIQQAMANIASLTNEGAAAIASFGAIADETTRATKFGFTDVTEAMQMFAAAGYESADAMTNILKPGLDLAAAGGTSTANAVSVMVSALKTFSLDAKEAGRVANLFAGGANVSMASVESLGESMTYAGSVASAYGMSLQETIGVLALYSDKGMQGSVAGTAFAQSMAALTNAAREAKTAIGEALAGWDPATEGMSGAIKRLEAAGISATDVLGEFGRQGGKAVASLLNSGSAAIVDYTSKVESVGDAALVAAQRQDTLGGSLKDLKGEIQRVQVALFSLVSVGLKSFVDGMIEATQWVSKLSRAMTTSDWSAAKAMMIDVFDSALAAARAAFDGIREGAGKIADAFRGIDWGSSMDALKTNAVSVLGVVVAESEQAVAKIAEYLKAQDWGAVWESAKSGAVTAFNFWYGHVADVWGRISDYLKNVNGAQLWESIKAGAQKAWTEIEGMARDVWPTIRKYAENEWSAISEAGRIAWEAIKHAWSTVDWQKIMGDIRAGFEMAVESVKDFGRALASNIGFNMTFDAINELLDTLVISFGHVLDAARWLFDIMKDVKWADVLETSIDAIDFVLSQLVTTVDMALTVVNEMVSAWRNLSGEVKIVIGVFTGTMGLIVATGQFVAQAVLATKAVIAWAIALQAQAISALETFYIKLLLVNTSMTAFPVLMAGAVSGAAALGVGLGLLIRQIPGVSAALDGLAVKVGEFLGLVESEDPALKANLENWKRLRAEHEASIPAVEAVSSSVKGLTEEEKKACEETERLTAAAMASTEQWDAVVSGMDSATTSIKTTKSFLETFNDSMADGRLETIQAAIAMRGVAPAADTMGAALTGIVTKTESVAPAMKSMKNMFKELNNIAVGIKIELPEMTENIVKVWASFFEVLNKTINSDVKVAIALPTMTDSMVKSWAKFFEVLNNVYNSKIEIAIALPKMTEAIAKTWAAFFEKLNSVANAKIEINIQLPTMTDSIARSWEKFFSVFKGGSVSIPEVGNMQTDIGSISKSLAALVAMKGIVWA